MDPRKSAKIPQIADITTKTKTPQRAYCFPSSTLDELSEFIIQESTIFQIRNSSVSEKINGITKLNKPINRSTNSAKFLGVLDIFKF